MKNITVWYKNLKFRRKITLLCLLVSIVPTICLGSFSYFQIRNLLITREKEVLTESLGQAVNSLNNTMKAYDSTMNYIVWDYDLKLALNEHYTSNYDMYLAYREVIDPLFVTVRSLHPEIDTVTVYSDNSINPHGDVLLPLSKIESLPWFQDIVGTTTVQFIASPTEGQLSAVSQLYMSYSSYTNMIVLDINYDKIFSTLSTLFDKSYGVVVFDKQGKPIYMYQDFSSEGEKYALSTEEILSRVNDNTLTQDYIYKTGKMDVTGWTTYLYRPISTISAAANQITIIVIIIIAGCIVFLLLASYILSKMIVRPLEKLTDNMEQIESGNMAVTVTQDSRDEIGKLIKQFGYMVKRLNYMINEVYKSKITQQEYEMKALQAQISPHFFYNSLSLINSKAILAGHDDISSMARFLSTFYRTTLNKGKNTISVQDEWKNMTSYIKIQSMMHTHSFDVTYELDRDIFGYSMLNLLLQPLVENAVGHGLDHKVTPGRGQLIITGGIEQDELLFTVRDNGCGIAPDILDRILTTETSGYGIQNVHHRVQLYYGETYGLTYESELGRGTKVSLRLPMNV